MDAAQKAVSEVIEKQGPEYWKALEESLLNAIDALDFEFTGAVTPFEGGLRVSVNRLGQAFKQNYTDLFYRRGAHEIRCATLHSGTYALKFYVTPENTIALTSTFGGGVERMDPAQASEHIMQFMIS